MPHMDSNDYRVFERLEARQREIAQRQQLAHLREPHLSVVQRLIGSLGTFFIALGTRLQQVKQRGEHTV